MIGCDCAVCTSSNNKDQRLRSSILVQSATTTIVVDTTPDFRYQMLRIANKKLDAVLYTHPHKDHIAGLDDIRAYNYFQKKKMYVYANSLTEEALRREYYYAFADTKYPGIPELELINIDETPFLIGDIPVQPILVWHLKMPVYGFRFGNFVYITDANRIDAAEKQKLKGADILVLNALRKESHLSHFTLEEAISLAKEIAPANTYFTHISHQLGLNDEVAKELPVAIHLAYDGLVLTV
jgi:phosphoribosyl 1,2-cyclic phosphate phosphodiesterase